MDGKTESPWENALVPSRPRELRAGGRAPSAAVGQESSMALAVGDVCTALSPVPVRAGEGITTNLVATLGKGARMKVMDLGSDRRAKVVAGSIVGWISVKTNRSDLVLKHEVANMFTGEGFKEGGSHALISMVVMRAGENLDAPIVAHLVPGTYVVITEMGSTDGCRAKVMTDTEEGWITLTTKCGDNLLSEKPVPVNAKLRSILYSRSISLVKSALEAGRSGNLESLKKSIYVHSANNGGVETVATRANVNCSDIRGRTTLIYASAFGNIAVVEFLLAVPTIDVNAVDDTMKSALHHAAKKGSTQAAVQAQIVQLLVGAKACIEARDHNGCTPVMFASANGGASVVKALVDIHANINVMDFEGHTPLAYAKHFHHHEVAELLRIEGAEDREENGHDNVEHGTELSGVADKKKARPKIRSTGGHPRKKKSQIVSQARKGIALAAGVLEGMSVGVKPAEEIAVPDHAGDGEDAARERALSKLRAVSQSATSAKELEAAIQEATEAGVQQSEIEVAEGRLKRMREHLKALEELHAAMLEPSVSGLREAIGIAETHGVSVAEVDAARAVLEIEEPRELARVSLREAQVRGDVASLKAALGQARHVNLDEAELAPLVQLLRGAESKEKAECGLLRAIGEVKVAGLKFSIQLAREAGVDTALIDRAEGILRVEEPKEQARERLVVAVSSASIGELRAAISVAREVGLAETEWSEAQAVLDHEELKQRLVAEIAAAVDKSLEVEPSSIDALREAKDDINNAINHAKDAGVAESALLEGDNRRRKLHNMIEDLKGSIRVFCRIRPLSFKEKSEGDEQITHAIDSMTLNVAHGHASLNFTFDAVFAPGTQEQVFEDCRDLVQSALDGYNVTIFAYGQTGAGKTYTMYGTPNSEGTSPRTIKELYRIMERDQARFNFTVMASMLELYQSHVVDLLVKNNPSMNSQKLNIRLDKLGAVQIEHLVEEACSNAEELMCLLERGSEQRAVAATAMNSESSRSHLILIINVVSVNKETRIQCRGKLLLCDLAGSERLKKSEVTGDSQKEAIEINKSLTALGDVIEGLTKKHKQIPYRNHKLTQLMQDSLGGSAKTLMFVTCSPANSNTDETIMSLKYATRAKRITNTHIKNAKDNGLASPTTKEHTVLNDSAAELNAAPLQSVA